VDLSWANPGDADLDSVVVLRRAGAAVASAPTEGATYAIGNAVGTSTVACVVAAPGTTCNDPSLTNGTAYYYAAFARDTYGNYSSPGTAAGPYTPTAPTPPSAPGTPGFSNVGATSLTAGWSASATGAAPIVYTLRQGASASGPWSDVAGCVDLSTTTCDVSGLAPNTTTHFQVLAENGIGSSTSASNGQLTLPGQPAMAAYSNVEQTTLSVSWTMSGAATGLTYAVERGASSSGPWTPVPGCGAVAEPTRSCNDSGLTANTTYWYQVRATNTAGSGAWATPTSVATKPLAPLAPGTPQASSVTTASMSVTWTASVGATSYVLQVARDDQFTTSVVTYDPATRPQAVSGLASNTRYWLQANATGAGGTSGWSPTGFAVTVPDAPGTPSFSGTTSVGTTVTWTAPGGDGTITSYSLDRAEDAAFSVGKVTTSHAGTETSVDVSGLDASTPYWFRVRAVNATGTSIDSAPGSVTTGAASQTLLATGLDPSPAAAPICPGDAAAYVDQFVFSSLPTADAIGSLVTGLGSGAGAALAGVEIRDAAGAPFSPARVALPSGDTASFSFSPALSSPLSPGAVYRLYATPLSQALMPETSFTLTARVTSFDAAAHPETGTDSANAFAIDNADPAAATWGTVTPGSNQIALEWTNPVADGGAALAHVVVLRRKALAPFSETLADGSVPPGEGTTTAAGSAVVYSRAATAGALVTFVDSGVVNENNYVYRVYALDACGNWNAGAPSGPHKPVGAFVAEGSASPNAPMISIVNPLKGSVVSGKFRIQIRVANPAAQGGIPGLVAGSLAYRTTDAEPWTTAGLTALTGYDTLTGGVLTGRTYEVQFTPPSDGAYTIRAKVSNGAVADVVSNVVVVSAVPERTGDGRLLVRDNSSQLCGDCHAVKSHSSEATSSRHGSWSMTCRDCHAPHGTRNVWLVNEQITPPALDAPQSPREVVFHGKADRARGDNKGVCQVCHTRTAFYRQDGTGASHETGNDCKKCHNHTEGLASTCTDCHGTAGRIQNPLVLGTVDQRLAAAPPKDTDVPANAANDALRVGAHEAHVNQATYRDDALFCADCHAGSSHQGTRDAGWSALATADGTVPSPAAATGFDAAWEAAPTCTTYCHGATLTGGSNRTPSWTDGYTAPGTAATCGACHGTPPLLSSTPGENHPQNTSCDDCHGVGYEAMTVAVKGNHIDGQYQGPANGCTACHGELAGPSGPAQPNTNLAAAPGYSATAVTPQGDIDPGAHDAHVRPTSGQSLMAGKSCQVCHGPLPANEDKSHANGSVAIDWSAPASSEGVSPTYTGGNCTNYCHSDAKPLGAANATTVPVSWAASLTFGCTDCHGDGAAGAALSPLHTTHLSAPYAYTCDECHASVVANDSKTSLTDASLHVNGARTVRFSSTLKSTSIDSSGGGYAGYTCSGTYCHSPGTKTTGFDPPVGPVALSWNGGSASPSCDDCHGGNASADRKLATGSHTGHVNNAATIGTTYACATCHADTVTADTTIKAGAPHVDGAKNVTAASWNGTTCAANSCHSNGKGTYASATWGDTLGCNGCHGTTHALGAPDYENGGVDVLLSNSHAKHVGSDPAACANCHPDTTSDGISVTANHANGAINVRLTVPGTYTPRSGNTSPSCSSISCHGDVKWGGALAEGPCSSCHLAAAGAGNQDEDDVFGGYQAGAKAMVDRDDWSLTGHGRATAFTDAGQSSNAAPNFPVTTTPAVEGCYYCHAPKEALPGGTQTSEHVNRDAPNPFRLANVNWNLKGQNGVCLVCHDAAGPAGFDPDGGSGVYGPRIATVNARVSATHAGADHATGGKGGVFCWDCHDPHGDFNYTTGRPLAFMIHLEPTRDHSGAAGWGEPTAVAAAVDFSSAVGGDTGAFDGPDYTDQTAPYAGVCQVCHTTTSVQLATGAGSGHQAGAYCIGCHKHDVGSVDAFKEATTCNACHNAPPSPGVDNKHLVHDGTTFGETSYANNLRHATTAQYGYACNTCHNQLHMDESTSPYPVRVVFGSFDTPTGTKTVGGSYVAGTPQTADTAPTNQIAFAWSSGTCSSTYCHSNATPLQGANAAAAPTWTETWVKTGGSANQCVKCHAMAADNTGLPASTNLSHAHYAHTTTYAYGCVRCHNGIATGTSGYPATAATVDDKTKHVDGAKDVAWDGFNSTALTYAAGGQYTCSNTYCHSNGKSTTPSANVSIAWNASATCASCHGDQATNLATLSGAHGKHVVNALLGSSTYACGDCHTATLAAGTNSPVTAPSMHVDKLKQVAIANRGAQPSTDTTTTCSATYCHSSGQRGAANAKRTVGWTDAAWTGLICNKCHGVGTATGAPNYGGPGNADTANANSHASHVGGSGDCATCHNATTATGTAIAPASTAHTNGLITMGWDTAKTGTVTFVAGSYSAPNYTSATCANVKCHGNNATPVEWGGPTLDCVSCHGRTQANGGDLANWLINDDVAALINTDEWTGYGHGSASVNLAQGKTGIDVCRYCHDWSVPHETPTNPFRLHGVTGALGAITAGSYDAATNNGNGICWNCHATGSNGVDPDGSGASAYLVKNGTKKIDSYHHGASDHGTNADGGARCWDCHDPHGDLTNLAMIGSDTLRDASDPYGFTGTRSTTGAILTTRAAGGYAKATSPYTGICQVCHTTTSVFRFDGSLQTHQTNDCLTACHKHDQPAANDAFKGAGSCLSCHDKTTDSTPPRAKIIGGALGSEGDDFIRASRHVSNGGTTTVTGNPTNSGIVTDFDCILCHSEGDPSSSGTNIKTVGSLHGNDSQTVKTVDLRNVDAASGDGVAADWPGARLGSPVRAFVGGTDPLTNDRDKMDTFCMGCHDANGAAGIAVNATNDGMLLSANPTGAPVARATKPFNTRDTLANAHDSAALNALRTRVMDVKSQFNSQNLVGKDFASHHNLRQFEKRYSSVNANWPAAAWTSYVTKEGQTLNAATVRETAGLHCSDCHLNEANAHGTRSTWYMLASASPSDATADVKFTTTGLSGGTHTCARCHASTAYGQAAADSSTVPRTDAHDGDCPRIEGTDVQGYNGAYIGKDNSGGTDHQLPCLMCHGGQGFGWIHGMNFNYKPWKGTVDSKTYRFQGGGGTWRWYSPISAAPADAAAAESMWTGNTSNYGCYTLTSAEAGTDSYGACAQHSGGQAKTGNATNYQRDLQY
jgi:predicted CxxxxCH...CXXCH cytochrome family protein